MLRKPKRLKPRLRDVDGTEYDPETGKRLDGLVPVTAIGSGLPNRVFLLKEVQK